jgi:hypothetical protein
VIYIFGANRYQNVLFLVLILPVERPVLTHGAIKYLKIILNFIIKLSEYLTSFLFFFRVTNGFFLYVSLFRYHFADNLIF